MARYFRPTTGDQSSIVIEDDGTSFRVNPDGSRREESQVHSLTKQTIPVWSISEMENLIAGGKWIEYTPDGQPAPTKPVERVTVGDATHVVDESEPAVHQNPTINQE